MPSWHLGVYFSETNLKVRQALPETAEMDNDIIQFGNFDGMSTNSCFIVLELLTLLYLLDKLQVLLRHVTINCHHDVGIGQKICSHYECFTCLWLYSSVLWHKHVGEVIFSRPEIRKTWHEIRHCFTT